MKNIVIAISFLILSQPLLAATVASQVTCYQLKTVVAQGELLIVGKSGKIYNIYDECGSNQLFKTQDGLCWISFPGISGASCSNPGSYNNENGGA